MIGRWWRRRKCMHGNPGGESHIRTVCHLDYGRKLYECQPGQGGCGRRWVL